MNADERLLTKDEYFQIRELYNSLYGINHRFWIIFLSCVSFCVFLILFLISFFADRRSFWGSILFGLMGPIFILVISFFNYYNYCKKNKKNGRLKFKQDLKERRVKIKTIIIEKAWRVFDPGYNAPGQTDLLFKVKNKNEYICIPFNSFGEGNQGNFVFKTEYKQHFSIPINSAVKSKMNLFKLKNTGLAIKVNFSGDEIPIANKVINAKNEWRNDDLPYSELFPFACLSDNLRDQLSEYINDGN